MPPHQRLMSSPGMPAGMQAPERKLSPQAQPLISRITDDIRALNSSILILSQKIKFLVRNEKILGRNLLVINKKVKGLQEGRMQGGEGDSSSLQRELADIGSRVSENTEKLMQLQSEVENIKATYAKADKVSEIKYVIDSINPLEFATLKDLQEATTKQEKKTK